VIYVWCCGPGGMGQLSFTSGLDSYARKWQWSVLVTNALTPDHAFNRTVSGGVLRRRRHSRLALSRSASRAGGWR
jgi:hypothetical protein